MLLYYEEFKNPALVTVDVNDKLGSIQRVVERQRQEAEDEALKAWKERTGADSMAQDVREAFTGVIHDTTEKIKRSRKLSKSKKIEVAVGVEIAEGVSSQR